MKLSPITSTVFYIPSLDKTFTEFPLEILNNPTLVAFPVGDALEAYLKDNVACIVTRADGSSNRHSLYTVFPSKEKDNG